MTSSPPFESARDVLAQRLEQDLQCMDEDETLKFAPMGTARDVFASERLHVEALYIAAQQRLNCPATKADATAFAIRLKDESLPPINRILAILICAGFHHETWRDFERSCYRTSRITDESLPLDKDTITRMFRNDGPRIFREQFAWCPVILEHGEKVEYTGIRRRCPLPRLVRHDLGSGSYGVVSYAHLARCHMKLDNATAEAQVYAQKDFVLANNAKDAFSQEWEVHRQIFKSRKSHANICGAVAALVKADSTKTTYSLFFKLATCNLHEYLYNKSKKLPDDYYPEGGFEIDAKKCILAQADSLIDALDYLHRELDGGSARVQAVWHLDLRPQNVLVTLDPNSHNKVLFQISDFGLSRLKQMERQSLAEDPSLTLSRAGGASECLAPEASEENSKVGSASDVWSLGCIVSLILIFMQRGHTGVHDFSERRSRNPATGSWFYSTPDDIDLEQDSDHYVSHHGTCFLLNACIHNYFAYFAQDCGPNETRTLQRLVDIVLKSALRLDPRQRVSAQVLHDRFRRAWPEFGEERVAPAQRAAQQAGASSVTMADSHSRDSIILQNRPTIARSTSEQRVVQPSDINDEDGHAYLARIKSAAEQGAIVKLRSLMQTYLHVAELRDEEGRSPLHYAAETSEVEVVAFLLGHGRIEPNDCDIYGKTALIKAVERNRPKVVQLFLDCERVDVNCSSKKSRMTPICFAALNGLEQVAAVLIADPQTELDRADDKGRTALSWACQNGFVNIAEQLLRTQRVSILQKDMRNRTPRHHANANGRHDVLRLLDAYEKAQRPVMERVFGVRRLRSSKLLRKLFGRDDTHN